MNTAVFQNAFQAERADAGHRAFAFLWATGTPLVLFPLFAFALTILVFALGGALSALVAWSVLAASAAGAVLISRYAFPAEWQKGALACAGLGALALLLSLVLHDTSIDGQNYHFEATYALAEGWNPLRKESEAPVIGQPLSLWAMHYPKGAWVFSANLLAAGLPLGTTKAINFLLLFASAALAGGTLIRFGFSYLFAALLTAAAAFNPIVVSQLFTAMNDGLFSACLLVFITSILVWVRFDQRLALILAIAAMMLAVNLKFSAIPILFVLAAFASFGALAVRGLTDTVRMAGALLAATLVGVILLGWSPFIQNYLDFGHPLYPLMGEHAVDIMNGEDPELENTPKVIEPLPAFQRFLFSLFSEVHSGYETTAELKLPFSVTAAEVRAIGQPDVRLSGFGPLFSGAILLSLAALMAIMISWRQRTAATLGLLFITAGLFMSVLVMPQNWWARYVPQFWLIPVCLAAAAITIQRLPVQVLGTATACVLLLNAAIAGASGLWLTTNRSAAVTGQIQTMQQTDQPYCVFPQMVHSRLYLMREAGIQVQYVPADDLSCPAPEEIAGYGPDRQGGGICLCPSDGPPGSALD